MDGLKFQFNPYRVCPINGTYYVKDLSLSLANSPEPPTLQNMHPPVPRVPSLFGHVQPISRLILYTFRPKSFR